MIIGIGDKVKYNPGHKKITSINDIKKIQSNRKKKKNKNLNLWENTGTVTRIAERHCEVTFDKPIRNGSEKNRMFCLTENLEIIAHCYK